MPVCVALLAFGLPCRSAPEFAAAVSCPPAEAVLACARAAAVPSLLLAAAGTRRDAWLFTCRRQRGAAVENRSEAFVAQMEAADDILLVGAKRKQGR